jgi:hypothetical protein
MEMRRAEESTHILEMIRSISKIPAETVLLAELLSHLVFCFANTKAIVSCRRYFQQHRHPSPQQGLHQVDRRVLLVRFV